MAKAIELSPDRAPAATRVNEISQTDTNKE